MPNYSRERKDAVLKKLLSPQGLSVIALARQEGIAKSTLYSWLNQGKVEGAVMLDKKRPDDWSAEAKFSAVLESALLSELELNEYCRKKGLYPQQVTRWREACISGQQSAQSLQRSQREEARSDKKRIRELERELSRKDKALAETAALLVLRKKLNAYWSNDNEGS